jgi:hypothetical protein
MADSEDLKLLMSGELDLNRCDFREAKLSGLDLRGRNFSHCLFERAQCEGTQFGGSDFRAAKVSFMKAKSAVFDDCNLEGLHFGYADLSDASFKNAKANRTHFQHVNLNGANLQNAQFKGASIDADTTLKGTLSNANTSFEGLKVLRPVSRDPLFKNYTFKDGVLHLQTAAVGEAAPDTLNIEASAETPSNPHEQSVGAARAQIQHLLQNAVVTRISAQHFASQIEDTLRDVAPTNGNMLAEPLQTMLEFAGVLRNLAPATERHTDPLDRAQLELRIAQLETIIERLTRQLSDETISREAAETLLANNGYMSNFRKAAGSASGTAAVAVVTSLVTVGVPMAAVYFLGTEHPLITTFLTVLGRLPTN